MKVMLQALQHYRSRSSGDPARNPQHCQTQFSILYLYKKNVLKSSIRNSFFPIHICMQVNGLQSLHYVLYRSADLYRTFVCNVEQKLYNNL